jgi:hypothetical protein
VTVSTSYHRPNCHSSNNSTACDYANGRAGFGSSPIHCVLFHGSCFEFFRFDGSSKPPTLSRGVFTRTSKLRTDEVDTLQLVNFGSTTRAGFIASLRPICETLFFCLLQGYKDGMETFYQRSLAMARDENEPRQSAPAWMVSYDHAQQALNVAILAAEDAAHGNITAANDMAERALASLKER